MRKIKYEKGPIFGLDKRKRGAQSARYQKKEEDLNKKGLRSAIKVLIKNFDEEKIDPEELKRAKRFLIGSGLFVLVVLIALYVLIIKYGAKVLVWPLL